MGRAGNVLTALMLTPKLMELHGDQKNVNSFTMAVCISLPQILGSKSRGGRRGQLPPFWARPCPKGSWV